MNDDRRDDGPDDHRRQVVARRTFLIGAGALAWSACTSSSSGPSDGDTSAGDTSAPSVDPPMSAGTTPTLTDPPSTGGSTPAPSEIATEEDAEGSESALVPLTAAQFDELAVCTALPETTAGPFPTIDRLDRRDVTEGRPGHPLRLGLRVVDAACVAVPGAAIEIWHTDATGDYSTYVDNGDGKDEGEGTTFMRGFQTTDADGIAEFETIYPGWYTGRAVHIHVTVRLDGRELLTTQLYFDEDYTSEVFTTGVYAEFGQPDTTWATDRLIGSPSTDGTGITLTAADTSNGRGSLGLANVGVRR